MTDKQNSIKILFNIDFSEKFIRDDTRNIITYLSEIIPGSILYYRYIGDRYGTSITANAREEGLEQEKKGKTLYLFDDDPDVIHWFAMNKNYYPLVKSLKDFLNYQFAEPFNAVDMESK